jgi:cation:H+ antiporter
MIVYVFFFIGFFLLIKGADLLVEGASSIAKRLNISDMVVGLTVVSFGTSMPELVVSLLASTSGRAELAIGNVLGSNIANVLLILGITAIICPLPLKWSTILSEIPFTLIAALLVGFLANVSLFDRGNELIIGRIDGLILLFFFCLYLLYIFYASRESRNAEGEVTVQMVSVRKSLLFILAGSGCLFLGGKWVVSGSIKIATILGLSESFIGLTIVAVGTSLPELITSAVAATRKNIDIAVGNVIGSNIFNLLWILGLSAVLRPLPFQVMGNFDILVVIFSSTLVILVIALSRGKKINRLSGVIFILCYAVYIVYLLKRG